MPRLKSGSLGALVIALLTAAASFWLIQGSEEIYCDRLPSIAILAMLSAFAIALCFRLVGRAVTGIQKWQIIAALVIAAGTLFADARFVIKYRGICSQLQQHIQQMK